MQELEGVILEVRGRRAVVLAADGSFRRLPVPEDAAVGQRITIPARAGAGGRLRPLAAALAAAVLLAALVPAVLLYPRQAEAVAVLSMDVGAVLELAVDREGRFLRVEVAEPAAAPLLALLEPLRGRPASEVALVALEEARRLGLLPPGRAPVLVLAAPQQGAAAVMAQLGEIRRQASRVAPVAAGVVDAEARAAAAAQGLGLARALSRVAEQEGVDVAQLLRRLEEGGDPGQVISAIRRLQRDGKPADEDRDRPGRAGDRGPGRGGESDEKGRKQHGEPAGGRERGPRARDGGGPGGDGGAAPPPPADGEPSRGGGRLKSPAAAGDEDGKRDRGHAPRAGGAARGRGSPPAGEGEDR